MTIGAHDKLIASRAEVDRRVRRFVEREHAERGARNEVRFMLAHELSVEERARFGFPADFTPRPSSLKRGRRRP